MLAFDALEHRQTIFDSLEPAGIGVERFCVTPQLHRHIRDFLLDGSETRRLRFQPGVQLRGRAHRRQRTRDGILVKRAQRLLTELGEPGGVPHRRALRAQLGVLARAEVGIPQLVELPPQEVLLTPVAQTHRLQLAERADRRRPCRVSCGDSRPQLASPRITIDQLGLCIRVEKRVVLVLPVNRDQVAPELAELCRVRRPAVDFRRAALAELSLEHQCRAARLEYALDGGALRAVPDLVGAPTRAQREPEGVDDQRLAAPGFSSEEVEAGPEPHARLGHQSEVADFQLLQQSSLISEGPAAGPNPASRQAADRSSPAG